jgi:4-amino-4-deoxy-L-arabinose transferase-like glycosyltransferase
VFVAQYDLDLTIKQIKLIRPMVDYACLIWMSAARTHVRTLQVLQSKYIRFSISAPWYTGNRKIREDLGVPYFSDHMRFLNERLKISWSGSPTIL